MQGIERQQLSRELCDVAFDFHRRGWCLGTGGNLSACASRDPFELLISVSGRHKGTLSPDDFVGVTSADSQERLTEKNASAEALIHLALCRSSDVGSVLHTHSVAGTLLSEHFAPKGGFSIAGYEMLKGLSGHASHEHGVFVPILPNCQDMKTVSHQVRARVDAYADCPGFLLAGHGLYAWGKSVREAHRHIEVFEFLFDAILRRTELVPYHG